jgi:hypothetical protein
LQHSYRYVTFNRFNNQGQTVSFASSYLPFQFDQTHVLNAVVSYRLPANWTIGTVVHFNTGYPEVGGVTSLTHVEGVNRVGIPIWVPVDRDRAARLRSFFRVDGRVSKTWIFDAFILEAYLDFFNVTISKELLGYDYTSSIVGGTTILTKSRREFPIFIPILGVKATY